MPKSITLLDGEAKAALRDLWPTCAENWMGSGKTWLRMLPFPISKGPNQPYLHRPGGGRVSNPDGLYACFGEHFVDLIALEHCGTEQNFNDKRSRYAQSHDGTILAVPQPWRSQWLFLIHGGRGGTYLKPAQIIRNLTPSSLGFGKPLAPWTGRPLYKNADPAHRDWKFPVRSVRCIYFLSPKTLTVLRSSGMKLSAHEFATTHGKLRSINQQDVRKWLTSAFSIEHML